MRSRSPGVFFASAASKSPIAALIAASAAALAVIVVAAISSRARPDSTSDAVVASASPAGMAAAKLPALNNAAVFGVATAGAASPSNSATQICFI